MIDPISSSTPSMPSSLFCATTKVQDVLHEHALCYWQDPITVTSQEHSWSCRFSEKEALVPPKNLHAIIHALHADDTKEFYAVMLSEHPHMLLIHKRGPQDLLIHKIQQQCFADGSCASVHTAGPQWVVRIPHGDTQQHLLAHKHLHKIHAKGLVPGVEEPPKLISLLDTETSEVLDISFVTVSKRALHDAHTLLSHVQDKGRIAYQLTQGLKACVDANVGHLDIKEENILLYGESTEQITEARLCDFDDTLALDNFDTYQQNQPRDMHTPQCVLATDMVALWTYKNNPNTFAEFKALVNQISTFELGLVLYHLYTATRAPLQLDPSSHYIIGIDTEKIQQTIDSLPLRPLQKKLLCAMLHTTPSRRPDISVIARSFAIKETPCSA